VILKTLKAALLAAAVLLPALTGWLARECRTPHPGPGTSAFFEVPRGRSVRAVLYGLRDRRLIRSSLALTLAYDLFYSRERLRAG
jgi:cell division protein YceG involved in septum cleavage